MAKRNRFKGFLDRIDDGYLIGWLFDAETPARSVCFDLFLRGKYFGQYHCAYLRTDLLKSGFGHGVHGFKVRLPDTGEDWSDLTAFEFVIPRSRTTLQVTPAGQITAGKGSHQKAGAFLKEHLARIREVNECTPPAILHSQQTAKRLSALSTYDGRQLSRIASSDFTEFLRRLQRQQLSDADFYSWYVNDYIYKLDRDAIPASQEECAYIRSSVMSARCGFDDPDTVTAFRILYPLLYTAIKGRLPAFWWAIEGGWQLNLDKSIVNPGELDALAEHVNIGYFNDYPLTYFMLIFALRGRLVSPVELLLSTGRQKVYEWCHAYARSNEHIARLLEQSLDSLSMTRSFTSKSAASEKHDDVASVEKRSAFPTASKIQLIGPFDKILGLGESARRLADAMQLLDTSIRLTCFNEGIQSASIAQTYQREIGRAETNIIHLNLEQIPEFFLKHGDILKGSYNIAFPYWELNKLSSVHHLALGFIDEIWSASSFVASLFDGHAVQATCVGLPARTLPMPDVSSQRARREFIFLTTFDAHSWPQRKNAIGVVQAFKDAFPESDDVQLIVKTQNADVVHTLAQRAAWQEIENACESDSRITIINKTLSPDDQRSLLASANCLVSLHRAEGLGIDLLDAVASGLPVIATDYSGSTDICTRDNSWLVGQALVTVKQEDYVFVEDGHLWAQPHRKVAAEAFNSLYRDSARREARAARGMRDALVHRSAASVSYNIRNRLNEIRQG